MNITSLGRGAAAIVLPSFLFACGGSGGGGNPGPEDPDPQLQIAQGDTAAANGINGIVHTSSGIYAVGFSDQEDDKTVVLRYNADGTLDKSFDGDGILELNVKTGIDVAGKEEPYGIAEVSGDDLLMVVNASDGNTGQSVYLVRLDSQNGFQIDTTYGNDGGAGSGLAMGVSEVTFGWATADNGTFPGGNPSDTAYDMLLDDNGRVVINGFGSAPMGALSGGVQATDRDRYVVRVNADTGQPDNTFATNGVFTWSSPRGENSGDNARRMALDGNSVISAGYTDLGPNQGNHVIVIKLDENGQLDQMFGNFASPQPSPLTANPGYAVFNPFRPAGGFAECYAAGVQTNGEIVTTGYGAANNGTVPSGDLSVYEPTTDGDPDTSDNDLVTFRIAGGNRVDMTFGNPDAPGTQAIQSEGTNPFTDDQELRVEERGRDMVMLPDNRSVQVGYYGGLPALYVFGTDGQLDTTVSDDGIILLPHDDVQNTGTPVTQQFFTAELSADGTLAVGTRGNDPAGARLVVISGLAGSE